MKSHQIIAAEKKKMKVVAFNGSPRKDGHTFILINYILIELGKEGMNEKLLGSNLQNSIFRFFGKTFRVLKEKEEKEHGDYRIRHLIFEA